MAKRKPKPVYNGITFDSQDEVEFYWWCGEAVEIGVLLEFRYQHPTYCLAAEVKLERKRYGVRGQEIKPKVTTLFQEATYTADFELRFSDPSSAVECGFRTFESQPVLVDVKPAFERVHARSQVFALNQKLVYSIHGDYVEPVVPVKLFARTWCPRLALVTKAGKPRNNKNYHESPTVAEWGKSLESVPIP